MSDSMYTAGNNKVALGKDSSNASLNISERIQNGSYGAREAMTIGGDKRDGQLFHGKSAGSPSKEMNSGNGERRSAPKDYLGEAAKYERGTLGAREEDGAAKKYGGDAKKGLGYVGKYAGRQAGKLDAKKTLDVGKTEPGVDFLTGTSDWRKNMDRAMRGIGGGSVRAKGKKD